MTAYAKHTRVSARRTRMELETLLERFGAGNFVFAEKGNKVMFVFDLDDRRMVFTIRYPPRDREDIRFTAGGVERPDEMIDQVWESECSRMWRSLLLAIKAKLVSIDDGVESVEEAFCAHILMPDGRTVAEHLELPSTPPTVMPSLTAD